MPCSTLLFTAIANQPVWPKCSLIGKIIGIVGLERIGSKITQYAKVFEMKLITWIENLTEEKAHRAGAELFSKERLFKEADFDTVHLVLGNGSRTSNHL